MESKELDRLFKDGLEQEFEFEGRARQWQKVATELHPLQRRLRFAWWWMGLAFFMGILGWHLFSQRTLSDHSIENTTPYTAHIELESPILEHALQQKRNALVAKPQNPAQETEAPESGATNRIRSAAQTTPNWYFAPSDSDTDLPATPTHEVDEASVEVPSEITLLPTEKDRVYDYDQHSNTGATRMQERLSTAEVTLRPIAKLPSFISAPKRALPTDIILPEAALTKVSKDRGIILMMGWQQSKTFDSAVEEDVANIPYLGLALRLAKNWQGVARFSQGNYNRSTTQAPSSYNIPLEDVPLGFTTPYQTNLQYRRSMLDLGVRYRLSLGTFARLQLLTGIQLAQHRNMEATYFYQNIYQRQEIAVDLPSQSWHLASLFGGLGLEVPVLPRLAATGSYQYYRDISNKQLRWPNNGQFLLGLQYQF